VDYNIKMNLWIYVVCIYLEYDKGTSSNNSNNISHAN
jgi:hypothetical protein